MGMRVHTAEASAVALEFCPEERLVELYGDEWAGHGTGLVIEDAGNCEALVLLGDRTDVVDFIAAAVRCLF